MSQPILPKGYNERGAFMGRVNELPNDTSAPIKLYLRNILTDGEYDESGAYWGLGLPVYWAHGKTPTTEVRGNAKAKSGHEYTWLDNKVDVYVRAHDRNEARRLVKELLPNATFYQ